MNEYEDISNKTFGRWTVLEESEPKMYRGRRMRFWLCKCDCGTIRPVDERALKSGKSKSCGCYHSDIMHDVGKINKTHGMTNTRLYRIYKHMINRCYRQDDSRYDIYGARGITVCSEWSTFENFSKWALENGYSDDLSIDRIDVNKNYSPDNCRWADIKTQANNKRNVNKYSYNGEEHTIPEWADMYGIRYKTLWKRLKRGMSIEDALLASN